MVKFFQEFRVTSYDHVNLNDIQKRAIKMIGSVLDLNGACREFMLDIKFENKRCSIPASVFKTIFSGSLWSQLQVTLICLKLFLNRM